MIGRISALITGIAIGAVLTFVGLKYHVVRADDGFHVVPKFEAQFSDAYVDVREFGVIEWDEHRELAMALLRAEKGHVLQDTATDAVGESIRGALDALKSRLPKRDGG